MLSKSSCPFSLANSPAVFLQAEVTPPHLWMTLQDGEEHIVHPQEDTSVLGGLQVVHRHGQQNAEGQADVMGVADGLLPLPQQGSQDVQKRAHHWQGRGLLLAGLSVLQLQGKTGQWEKMKVILQRDQTNMKPQVAEGRTPRLHDELMCSVDSLKRQGDEHLSPMGEAT